MNREKERIELVTLETLAFKGTYARAFCHAKQANITH